MRFVILQAMMLTAATASCSFILDYDAGQCDTQADCDALASSDPRFVGTQCTPDRVCSLPGSGSGGQGGGGTGCVSSEQCTTDNNGLPHICREPGGACIPLLSEDCIKVIGNYQDQNAIIMGFMHLIAGSQLFDIIGRNFGCATELAVNQFDNATNGLPNPVPGGGSRPLAFVMCNEGENRDRATHHLVDDVGVKAILGPGFSDVIVPVVTGITAPANVLTLSPAGGSVQLIDLMDNGLQWSVIANDAFLWQPLPLIIEDVETKLRTADPMLTNIRLAMITSEDLVSATAGDYLLEQNLIVFNNGKTALENAALTCGGPKCFQRFTFPEDQPDWGALSTSILGYDPHIILVADAVGDFARDAMPLIEDAGIHPEWLYDFPNPHVPVYIQGDLPLPPPVDLYTRVRSLAPTAPSGPLFDTFKLNLIGLCTDIEMPLGFPPFVEHVFDGVYLLGYAHLAAGNYKLPTSQLGGQQLAEGLAALCPEGQMNPGSALEKEFKTGDIQSTIGALTAGSEVNVTGVSGAIDFDTQIGSPPSNVDVYCIDPGASFPDTAEWLSVQTWDPVSGAFNMPFSCPTL